MSLFRLSDLERRLSARRIRIYILITQRICKYEISIIRIALFIIIILLGVFTATDWITKLKGISN